MISQRRRDTNYTGVCACGRVGVACVSCVSCLMPRPPLSRQARSLTPNGSCLSAVASQQVFLDTDDRSAAVAAARVGPVAVSFLICTSG